MSASRSSPDRIARHIAALPRSGIRDFFDLVSAMEDVVSLGIGEPDFVTPWHIREATIYALDRGHTSYTSNLGLLSLRRAVCEYVAGDFGVQYSPENECIITVGVSEALDVILRALLNPGDEVVYHEPCYVSYAPGIRMTHGVPVAVSTRESDGFALDPAALARAITPRTKALLVNFPNNPTGANLSQEAKQAIAGLAIENDLVVITDEIYSELTYGARSPSLAALPGMKDRTVFLHGFSKAYAMTGYRIGYACGPPDLIEAMMKVHQYTMLCASRLAQEAAVEALRNGRREMEKMRTEYRQRRNVIVRRLNEMGLPCVPPEGAFYVFPRVRETGLSSHEFAMRLLAEKQVAVVPGTAFGACGEGYIRCSYATALDEIEVAMDRLRDFLAGL
ncbi:MAG: aminotransferase class I/II-fold pyridoxal phosphate-dependent enzyme [Kiritimatiellaeota bacterium]|nr:aminotransferase class I/II-fold pyridoxal phosphate-dependent enzyme [Kiritimatiellota bacterium]